MDEQARVDEIKKNLISFKTVFEEYAKEIFSDTPRHEHLDKLRTQLQVQEPKITGYVQEILDPSAISVGSLGFRATISTGSLLATALLGGNNELPHNFRDFNTPVTSTLNRAIGKIEAGLWPPKEVFGLETAMISRLETFLNGLIGFSNLLPKAIGVKRPKKEIYEKANQLRLQLLEDSGKYKNLIAELTDIPTTWIKPDGTDSNKDRWVIALRSVRDSSAETVLRSNIDITRQAIGGLKSDINQGIRDKNGKLTEKTVENVVNDSLTAIENICNRFSTVSRQLNNRHNSRPTLDVNDEYDVQDLLHALLLLHFKDIRKEEWTPSFAGASSRMDLLVKSEQLVIEAKKTSNKLRDKEIGKQLKLDIVDYRKHPNCKTLVCFVFDPQREISNPTAIENDLAELSTKDMLVKVFIRS
jgi:hypothetical protein